jgi:DNA mismatch repair protein MutL
LINQQAAHERVLYEQYSVALTGKTIATQRSLFPVTFELAAADAAIMQEIIDDLSQLGYLVEPFGKNSFVVQGTPADVEQGNEKVVIEKMLEQYKHFSIDLKFTKREKLLRSMALQQSIKAGSALTEREMKILVEDLFNCATPNITPNGKPTWLEFKKEELDKMFGR